jgi:hypothetical protein
VGDVPDLREMAAPQRNSFREVKLARRRKFTTGAISHLDSRVYHRWEKSVARCYA